MYVLTYIHVYNNTCTLLSTVEILPSSFEINIVSPYSPIDIIVDLYINSKSISFFYLNYKTMYAIGKIYTYIYVIHSYNKLVGE